MSTESQSNFPESLNLMGILWWTGNSSIYISVMCNHSISKFEEGNNSNKNFKFLAERDARSTVVSSFVISMTPYGSYVQPPDF